MSNVTLTADQFAELMAAVASNTSAEEAAVKTSKTAPKEAPRPLKVVFEALEGEEAEKYGDVSITKVLPNGQPRKRMVLHLDDAVELAEFVLENFEGRL